MLMDKFRWSESRPIAATSVETNTQAPLNKSDFRTRNSFFRYCNYSTLIYQNFGESHIRNAVKNVYLPVFE